MPVAAYPCRGMATKSSQASTERNVRVMRRSLRQAHFAVVQRSDQVAGGSPFSY